MDNKHKKKKVRFVQYRPNGSTVTVAMPKTRRMARRNQKPV